MEITQADGSVVEVMTAEEVEEKVSAATASAVENYLAENPADNSEVESLKVTVAALQESIKQSATDKTPKGQDKTSDLEARLSEAITSFSTKFEEKMASIQNASIADTKTEMLSKLSGGDKELEKKIEFEFNNYKTSETSKQAIQDRMEKAYQLATGNQPKPGIMDTIGGGKGNPIKTGDETPKLSDNALAMAKILGITDEDVKKYGPKK